MKVRCTKLISTTGKPQEQSSSLTLGRVYHVLAVSLDTNGDWRLRLVSDSEMRPALFRFKQFEVISDKIPSTWIVSWNENGFFQLTPHAWDQPGFWEKYYDRDPEAIQIFEEEKRKIIEADP